MTGWVPLLACPAVRKTRLGKPTVAPGGPCSPVLPPLNNSHDARAQVSRTPPVACARGHGEAVIDPPLAESGGVLAANRAARSEYCYDFHGRCLSQLAVEARAELLAEARAWTAGYRDLPPLPDDAAAPLLMAGHQPQLFHPGVWFKNFALDALARRHGGLGVNLVVDNDTMKSSPSGCPGAPSSGLGRWPCLWTSPPRRSLTKSVRSSIGRSSPPSAGGWRNRSRPWSAIH